MCAWESAVCVAIHYAGGRDARDAAEAKTRMEAEAKVKGEAESRSGESEWEGEEDAAQLGPRDRL